MKEQRKYSGETGRQEERRSEEKKRGWMDGEKRAMSADKRHPAVLCP